MWANQFDNTDNRMAHYKTTAYNYKVLFWVWRTLPRLSLVSGDLVICSGTVRRL